MSFKRTARPKHFKILGATEVQATEIFEESVLQTLRPKIVLWIACSKYKAVMLLADGCVYEFPRNSPPSPIKLPDRAVGKVQKVAAGEEHFVAITDHLSWNLYTWGSSNAEGQLGRETFSEDSIKFPQVVKFLPTKVSGF